MSREWELDLQYAKIMEKHPFGIALYRPLPFSIFRPGAVGYFDNYGNWNPIAQLDEPRSVTKRDLAEVDEELERAPADSGIKWGPKMSEKTKMTKVDLSAGVAPATGIPVTVSALVSFSTDADVGGVLLTSSPVTHEKFYHASPFKNWVKANAFKLVKKWPEIKDHGLWVVTSTFSAKKCAINMWNTKGKGFAVGFGADVVGLAGAGAGSEWYRSQTDEGWGEYTTEGTDNSVVFFGGLKFQWSWTVRGKDFQAIPRPMTRAAIDDDELILSVLDPEDDKGRHMEVDCETYLPEEEYLVDW